MLPQQRRKYLYKLLTKCLGLFFCLNLLDACGHYGNLYLPEDASQHQHHPQETIPPKTESTSKNIQDYGNLDDLSIPEIINQMEKTPENNSSYSTDQAMPQLTP